jgi:phosphatidylinositol glycan class V
MSILESRMWGVVVPRLLLVAILWRFALLVFMGLADALIPDHNPGDDVLRFDLRLSSDCFCLQGHACDPHWRDYDRISERNCIKSNSHANAFISQWFLPPLTKWDAARFLALAADPWQRYPAHGSTEDAEQAHAFFPLWPLAIRQTAIWLEKLLPSPFRPTTFEATLVVSGIILTNLSFLIALFSLVNLTLQLTASSSNEQSWQVAGTVSTLFLFNPATVFFASVYSESFFAMLTFVGYTLYHCGHYSIASLFWIAASYTRSNGILVVGWLLIQGVASLLKPHVNARARMLSLFWHILLAATVFSPILFHDLWAYRLVCEGDQIQAWCKEVGSSMYSYVQRKHWNVGFLRYYQVKQIPNFFLASPILYLSVSGVVTWLKTSWSECAPSAQLGLPKVLGWAVAALERSKIQTMNPTDMFHHASMLAHYAVLCAATLLSLSMAHIQISTRLIFSTCPALYWHLAHQPKRLIAAYLFTYIVLGCVMHVNFLPWT